MRSEFDLTGRTAIVTGGGGILGQGFCEVLAATAPAWRCSTSIKPPHRRR